MMTMAVLTSLKVSWHTLKPLDISQSFVTLWETSLLASRAFVFFFAEEEGSSFEDVEHNENILTLGLVG